MATLPYWSPRLILPLLALLASCLDPAPEDLAGTWRTAPEDLQPAGWYETRLSFSVYGGFEQEVRSYGLYEGQERNELSAYERIKGTYRVEGDRLRFETSQLIWWDPTFYGSREQVLEPYDITLYDNSRYVLEGSGLVLHYTSYPLDAPEAASRAFSRER